MVQCDHMRICQLEHCKEAHKAKGYCSKHYQRFKNHGNVERSYTKRNTDRSHELYNVFWNMIKRCNDKNNQWYGERGIKVCDRWSGDNGFQYFVEDMGKRPKGHQMDRVDVDGDYTPENCRWVDKYDQMSNIRTNNKVVGVGWHKQRQKWRARIKVGGRDKSLGLFKSREDAIAAREKALCLQKQRLQKK